MRHSVPRARMDSSLLLWQRSLTLPSLHTRRFLLEKYPHLAFEEASASLPQTGSDDADKIVSVLDELAEEGGPDLPLTQGGSC